MTSPERRRVAALLHSGAVQPLISAVNLCEVHTRLLRDGLANVQITTLLAELKLTVIAFEAPDAHAAGELYAETRQSGLSLGDRACLALARGRKLTVWTADKIWKKLKVGVEIELIRI